MRFSPPRSYVKCMKAMKLYSSLFCTLTLAVLILAVGCGVKGAPTPYVEAYPDKTKEVVQAPAKPTPSPSPSPSSEVNVKKPAPKKKKQE